MSGDAASSLASPTEPEAWSRGMWADRSALFIMYQIYIQNSVSRFKVEDALLICFFSQSICFFFCFTQIFFHHRCSSGRMPDWLPWLAWWCVAPWAEMFRHKAAAWFIFTREPADFSHVETVPGYPISAINSFFECQTESEVIRAVKFNRVTWRSMKTCSVRASSRW